MQNLNSTVLFQKVIFFLLKNSALKKILIFIPNKSLFIFVLKTINNYKSLITNKKCENDFLSLIEHLSSINITNAPLIPEDITLHYDMTYRHHLSLSYIENLWGFIACKLIQLEQNEHVKTIYTKYPNALTYDLYDPFLSDLKTGIESLTPLQLSFIKKNYKISQFILDNICFSGQKTNIYIVDAILNSIDFISSHEKRIATLEGGFRKKNIIIKISEYITPIYESISWVLSNNGLNKDKFIPFSFQIKNFNHLLQKLCEPSTILEHNTLYHFVDARKQCLYYELNEEKLAINQFFTFLNERHFNLKSTIEYEGNNINIINYAIIKYRKRHNYPWLELFIKLCLEQKIPMQNCIINRVEYNIVQLAKAFKQNDITEFLEAECLNLKIRQSDNTNKKIVKI